MALLITGTDFSLLALIGVILLIGIVKKNAIMMIDFALAAERERGLSSRDAIFEACQMRFRPIMMTSSPPYWGQCRWPSGSEAARDSANRWAFRLSAG